MGTAADNVARWAGPDGDLGCGGWSDAALVAVYTSLVLNNGFGQREAHIAQVKAEMLARMGSA